MIIKVVEKPISRAEASEIAKELYGDMVKGVVDIEREIIALGGEWHIDANNVLVEQGSAQPAIWGFNFYPAEYRIEYTALINIRPAQGNRRSEIQDDALKERMAKIIKRLIV